MKKILIVVPNDDLGGAEQILKMIALYHKDDVVEVFFLSKKRNNLWQEVNSPHNKLKYFNVNSTYIGALLFFASSFISRGSYNRVYSSQVLINGLVGFLIKIGRIKVEHFVARESTLIFQRLRGIKLKIYRLMYTLGYGSITLLICQTEEMKAKLLEALPWLSNVTRIVVIENPVDLDRMNEMSSRRINLIDTYGEYIVSAGRLIPAKGYDLLIDAFYNIRDRHKNLNLVVLGEGESKVALTEKIKNLGLDKRVFFVGYVENVYPYFRMAKACVVSSRIEGFPNVLLQMMSQNERVISTKCAYGIDRIQGLYLANTNSTQSLEMAVLSALDDKRLNTRVLFDSFLKARSVDGFATKISSLLHE